MLGARIASLRHLAGMSQTDLARHLYITPSAVGMYEQGRRTPSINILSAISELFGISMDYLITGVPHSLWDTLVLNASLNQAGLMDGSTL